MLTLLGSIAGPLIKSGFDVVTQVFQSKKDRLQAKSDALKRAAEQESATAFALVDRSYKDELWAIVLGAPIALITLVFPIMSMLGYDTNAGYAAIKQSFERIKDLPDWYFWLIIVMVLKAYGVPVFQLIGKIAGGVKR